MLRPQTIDDYVGLLRAGTPFTQANYGDGEFLVLCGYRGANSDGRTGSPEKAEALERVLTEPRLTFIGFNAGRLESESTGEALAWLRRKGFNVPVRGHTLLDDPEYGTTPRTIRWVHKEIISSANLRGELGGFLRALRARPRVIVVGPPHAARMANVLGAELIWRPLSVDWEGDPVTEARVRQALQDAPEGTVITWSLGFSAKRLMWRLAPDYPRVTQIDVGACWDPYGGVQSRSGYRRPEWADAEAQNLSVALAGGA